MKILQLSDADTWSGGVEQLVLLSKGLKEQKHEVFIGCNSNSRLSTSINQEQGLSIVNFDLHKEIKIGTIKSIINFVRENKIDIIHAHHSKAHSLGLIASIWLPDTIFIATRRVIFKIRGNPLSRLKYQSKRVDKIIAISEAVKKTLINTNVPAEKIALIYSVVDTKRFNPDIKGDRIRQEFNIGHDEILVGKIANYSFNKGHDIFLKAAQIITRENPKVKFMIVGEGTFQNETLQNLARSLNISDKLICTGYRKDIPEIIAALDVSVNAARLEALCNVILQSLAMGKGVAATDSGGKAEIVKHNETGFLAPDENYELLAKYILELVNNKEKNKQFGINARKFIEENFTKEIMVNKTIELYQQLKLRINKKTNEKLYI